MAKKDKTQKEKEAIKLLSEVNNKQRWFFVNQPFKIFDRIMSVGWYEMTGTRLTVSDVWVHEVKKKGTKENFRLTDKEYKSIVKEYSKFNEHLK